MAEKFTEGNWYLSLDGKIMVKDERAYTQICQMPFGSAREADEMPEAKANARLIAQAPAMYEALQHIHEMTHDPNIEKYIEAVLAKIEGK